MTTALPVPHDRVDFSALRAPVETAEVRAFRQATKASGSQGGKTGVQVATMVFGVMVVAIVFFVFAIVGTVFVSLFLSSFGSAVSDLPLVLLVFPLIVLAAVVLVVVAIVRRVRRGSDWQRWYRLDRFAAANGFDFAVTSPDPAYPGTVFGLGRNRTSYERLKSTSGRLVELGSYRYTTGSGDDERVSSWGYIAVALDRPVPHMLLDARANDGAFSSLPVAFDRRQVLSLEGDFDRYFRLYTPREYERDALYVFTPDLMALLIDEAAGWDVELVDRWLFFYAPDPIDSLDVEAWRRVFRAADLVGSRVISRTQRYADERAGGGSSEIPGSFEASVAPVSSDAAGAPAASAAFLGQATPPRPVEPTIAPGGQRLRGGIRWASVAGVVGVIAWWIVANWLTGR
ncbi:hypothetical protein ASE14_06825 [Agromyces sp. Root81]|uniref:hypothetical protein n=1 Tax=Agromyces sp. Root81 TaxID=1736601 RepID=UPI0006F577EB|nr:hypothetical protein [Agromyces sp. Root81]KRC60692.1 hypothetical protein ASE14_06825 [Agromyces sp. Root81]